MTMEPDYESPLAPEPPMAAPAPLWVWILVVALGGLTVYSGYTALSARQLYLEGETARLDLSQQRDRLKANVADLTRQVDQANKSRDEVDGALKQSRANTEAATAQIGDLQKQVGDLQQKTGELERARDARRDRRRPTRCRPPGRRPPGPSACRSVRRRRTRRRLDGRSAPGSPAPVEAEPDRACGPAGRRRRRGPAADRPGRSARAAARRSPGRRRSRCRGRSPPDRAGRAPPARRRMRPRPRPVRTSRARARWPRRGGRRGRRAAGT